MFKVFVKFPDALRPAFPRLKERLEDPDPGYYTRLPTVVTTITKIVYVRPWVDDDHYHSIGFCACCGDDPYQPCILGHYCALGVQTTNL